MCILPAPTRLRGTHFHVQRSQKLGRCNEAFEAESAHIWKGSFAIRKLETDFEITTRPPDV